MQAVILAGGRGTRLASRLAGRPKPLVDVLGVPLLERQLVSLAASGVDDFVILVSHNADQIKEFLNQRNDFGVKITLIDDGEPRGTAGATLAAREVLAETFLVVYGDTLFDVDIATFRAFHHGNDADISLFLHPNDHPYDSDLVEIGEDNAVVGFHGYPHPSDLHLSNLVNAALYIVERRVLDEVSVPAGIVDFAKDLFPQLLKNGARIFGYRSFEYIKDLGTPDRLDKAERHLQSGVVCRARRSVKQKCVFLDRDGTLNLANGYIRTPEDLVLCSGAADAVKELNDAEFRVALVTNQPVIARGEVTVEQLRTIHAKLEAELGRAHAYLDGIFYCPHHPHSGFAGERRELKGPCECRKPKAGLIFQAAEMFNADLSASWMIGDTDADVGAGRASGVRSIRLTSGQGAVPAIGSAAADFTMRDIGEAAHFITSDYPALLAQAKEILDQAKPGTLILIGGMARSGKSSFASMLRHEFANREKAAAIVALDRWIRPVGRREAGLLGRYDLEAANGALGTWLAGGSLLAQAPIYDRIRREWLPEQDRLAAEGDDILIIEGVPALIASMQTNRPTIRVYVDTDSEVRRGRLFADLEQRGADPQSARNIAASRVLDEDVYVMNSRTSADYIVSGASGRRGQ